MFDKNVKSLGSFLKSSGYTFKPFARTKGDTGEKVMVLFFEKEISDDILAQLYLLNPNSHYFRFNVNYNEKRGKLEIEISFTGEDISEQIFDIEDMLLQYMIQEKKKYKLD